MSVMFFLISILLVCLSLLCTLLANMSFKRKEDYNVISIKKGLFSHLLTNRPLH